MDVAQTSFLVVGLAEGLAGTGTALLSYGQSTDFLKAVALGPFAPRSIFTDRGWYYHTLSFKWFAAALGTLVLAALMP